MLSLGLALFFQTGCDYGFTLPSTEPPPDGKLSPGLTLPIRKRRNILPGHVTGPEPPEPGIVASQCDQISDGGPVLSDGCTTSSVSCGQTLIGSTFGGINRYPTRFYEAEFCTPATVNHNSGDERVYRLDLPTPTRAIVTLDTPCGDLDLAAVKYSGEYCPSTSSNVAQCEENRKDGTHREQVDLWNDKPSTWWLIVEGAGDAEGAFSLTVQCEETHFH